ncbi:MAG: NYN domain-containing protein [Phycisphaerales bacterium]
MLLVDAYNALHVTGVLPPHLAGLDGPALAELVARSRWGASAGGAVLVCDGVKPRGWPTRVEGVELRFAGPGRDADTLIERLIADSPDPRRLTVVSSDQRVRKAARRRKCVSLTSPEFLRRLVGEVESPRVRGGSPAAGKPDVPLDPFALRRWLDEFGIGPEEIKRIAGEARTARSTHARPPEAGEAHSKETSQVKTRPPAASTSSGSDLTDADMRSMLAEAIKMWSQADIPADLDLTAWLDTLINPPDRDALGDRSPRSR